MDSFKIVMVEDDFQFMLKVEMLLDEMGLKLMAKFESAEEAMPYIQANPPDLILMDIFLKGKMTGVELANKVNDLGIAFIIFSADTDQELYDVAKKVNLIAYIIKPFVFWCEVVCFFEPFFWWVLKGPHFTEIERIWRVVLSVNRKCTEKKCNNPNQIYFFHQD